MESLLENFLTHIRESGIETINDARGADYTTYRVGGPIDHLIRLATVADIEVVSDVITRYCYGLFESVRPVVIGKGSNVIIDDEGIRGCVFVLGGELAACEPVVSAHNTVDAYAGVALPSFARQCGTRGIAGLEFYVGIPGSVGGAVIMNAGGHGAQTSDVLVDCDVLDLVTGTIGRYENSGCEFTYRHSRFTSRDLVIRARFRSREGKPDDIKSALDEIVAWRREHQPGGRNVGSVFQNHDDVSAAELIDSCGLKGTRIGGAHVSEKHANFIQADPDTHSSDILALIDHIKTEVMRTTGYELHTEVRYIPAL